MENLGLKFQFILVLTTCPADSNTVQHIFTNHKFTGAVAIICRGDPDLEKREKEYIDTYANPFPAAKKGYNPIMHYTCGFEESEDYV